MKLNIGTELPLEAVTQTFAILAKRGVGKTYTGMVMVEEMLSHGQQVVIADPVGVWWGLRSSANGRDEGFPIVVFGGEHADVPLEEDAGEIIAKSIVENGFSAILDLSLFRKAQQIRFMTAFAESLYRLNRKPLHFMVDEADEFAPQRPMHGTERLLGAFEDIVRRGRARGLGSTLITQRAAVLNKNVLTQIEVLIVLRTIAPQDREAIAAWTEIHGTKKQLQQLDESIASLPIGTAWFWSPGWLDIFKKVEIRKRTTFDSSATPKVGEQVIRPKTLAKIDIEKLGEQIKSTVQKIKDNDPVLLKRKVAELERKLSSVKPVETTKEVSILTEDDRNLILRAEAGCQKILEAIESEGVRLIDSVRDMRKFFEPIKLKISVPPQRAAVCVIKPDTNASGHHYLRTVEPAGRRPALEVSFDGNLPKAERLILTAAIQRQPKPSSRSQLALLSGYSVNSGGFNNAIGKLRGLGLLAGGGDSNFPTEKGASLIPVPPLPTGEELLHHWLSKLPKAERTLLKIIASHNGIDKEQLSQESGYSFNSGGFNNALGKLRTLELIERGWPAKASPEFFEL